MNNEYRPDPDVLLQHIEAEEAKQTQGKLKIFLGYAAGVGKTYAMLEAAQQRKAEGADVVAAYIETHKRPETEELLAGLEVLPRRKIAYRGVTLEEMDIDAVVARAPQIALVDELAHTNALDSRHTKRYQDVEELLNVGIDVYTTMNVQHLESLNDVVAQITEVIVRETVPDRILGRADQIVLVDLPPEELIQRLHEGKVYVPEQAQRAVRKFFRAGNLTALRELALRQAARRVDEQMTAYMQTRAITGPWAAGERLMVCISPSPLSQKLIRTTCRLAGELDAEWLAVYIETAQSAGMDAAARRQLAENLRLAESLGAKVLNLPGDNTAETLTHYAHLHNVTKIIIGKPLQPRWREVLRGSLVDQVVRRSRDIDVYVISSQTESQPVISTHWIHLLLRWRQWIVALALVSLISAFGLLIYPFTSPTNLVMFYLLGVMLAAIRYGRGAAILTAVLSVVAFNVGFVPPRFTLAVSEPQYLLTFAILGGVGIVIATLASQMREHARSARQRELHTSALYSLSRDLSAMIQLDGIIQAVLRHVSQTFACETALFLRQEGKLKPVSMTSGFALEENELIAARWVFEHGQPAGQETQTLPAVKARFLPLKTAQRMVGVLGVRLREPGDFAPERIHLLEAFASQAALGIDAVYLSEEARQAQLLKETERLQSALLNSISHDLRTPLVSITGALSSLSHQAEYLDDTSRAELINGAREEADRLNRLVGNLLEMTRLEANAVRLRREPADVQELIGVAVAQLQPRLREREVTIDLLPDLPMVDVDFALIVQVLVNLLDNACKYAAEDSPVQLSAEHHGMMVMLTVADRGIGVQEEELTRIFDKFYRSESVSGQGGIGLGLSICKGIVEAHGGRIWAEARSGGGTLFAFTLPAVQEQ